MEKYNQSPAVTGVARSREGFLRGVRQPSIQFPLSRGFGFWFLFVCLFVVNKPSGAFHKISWIVQMGFVLLFFDSSDTSFNFPGIYHGIW